MIDRRLPRAILVGLALCGCALPAFAHTGHAGHAGLIEGFLHPFTGLDHLLAMVAVGVWSAQLGRRALWALPVAFPLMMAAGGAAAIAGVPLGPAETLIGFSVLVLGMAIAFEVKARAWIAASLVGVFAIFHGHAHAVEMPPGAAAGAYAAGFLAATVLLHLAGIGLGTLPQRTRWMLRAAGAGVALAGAALLAA